MKLPIAFSLLLAFTMLGCSKQEASKVASNFDPPPEHRLAEADVADCEYESKLSDIVGVVSPESQAGWPATDDYKIHNFDFASWRYADGDKLQSALTVLRPVPVDSDYFGDFEEGDILRVRVLLSVDQSRAIVAEVTDEHFDAPELEAVANELAKPVVIETERFGKLSLDRSINWFQGTVVWGGREVEITFDADDDLDISGQLKTAQALFDAEQDWQSRIEAFAVKERLSLANDWRDEGVKPITEREFLERMELEAISIKPNGEFEFWHSDGDLFYGHSIQISGSLEKGLIHSDIPG